MNELSSKPTRAPSAGAIDFPGGRQVDVIVLGGGPAGSATAIALANAGRTVTVAERSYYDEPRIGETLPPEISQPLIELGVWNRFLADRHLESPGIVTAWGDPDTYENDFLINPFGPGWHVDRRRFDATLAGAAVEAGAELMCGAERVVIDRGPCGWQLDACVERSPICRRATVLVDATGRSASPARRLGAGRIVIDRLVGLIVFTAASHSADRRTLIESAECGWWYAALLPDGRQVVALMTDADLLPAGRDARAGFWHHQLRKSLHVRARIGPTDAVASIRVAAAGSSRASVVAGDNWLAVGDAAAAVDPLSSQGVVWALHSGLAAPRAIDARLHGERRALAVYADDVESQFAHYLTMRALYYARERRWPDSLFWRRRHQPTDGLALQREENPKKTRKEIRRSTYP